jgi:hypothetical protein
VNSEELEVSLRTEFENYLKSILADMKQEISQLQETVTTEIERHKSQLDEVFTVALNSFEKEREFDAGFKESVIEHLRLSRDEGAQITAMAIAKAEELEKEKELAKPRVGVKEVHQAVNEISNKTTQSEILKTLVHHATDFAPRGAFFIVKNEHLVGWRVFGKEKGAAEEKVREVYLPISANSVLGEAVKSLTTVINSTGGQAEDVDVFQKLEFGKPERMVAIPLVARGRGVAVLYADYGNEDGEVNIDGLETLVRVAGLTVEVLASAKTPGKKPTGKKVEFAEEESVVAKFAESQAAATSVGETVPSFVSQPAIEHSFEPVNSFTAPTAVDEDIPETNEFVSDQSPVQEEFETVSVPLETNFEDTEQSQTTFESEPELTEQFETNSYQPDFETVSTSTALEEEYPSFETSSWSSTDETAPGFSAQEFAKNFAKETDPSEYAKDYSYQAEETSAAPTEEYQFETTGSYNEVQTDYTPQPEEFVPTKEQTFGSFEPENGKVETVELNQPVSSQTAKSRLSERNVDLPIEVTEDERRLHNDSRRFARLLV